MFLRVSATNDLNTFEHDNRMLVKAAWFAWLLRSLLCNHKFLGSISGFAKILHICVTSISAKPSSASHPFGVGNLRWISVQKN